MGKAKQAGTFEERRAIAIERNAKILAALPKCSENLYVKFVKKHGVKKLVNLIPQIAHT
jgi:hypothetical protein